LIQMSISSSKNKMTGQSSKSSSKRKSKVVQSSSSETMERVRRCQRLNPDLNDNEIGCKFVYKKVMSFSRSNTAKKMKRSQISSVNELDSQAEEGLDNEIIEAQVDQIFSGKYFAFTSNKPQDKDPNSKETVLMKLIKEYGGIEIEEDEDFMKQATVLNSYLIAESPSKTVKYLFALASSIPCVSPKFLKSCVQKNQLVDFTKFMLPAGKSLVTSVKYIQTRKLKETIFKGLTFFVNSMIGKEENKCFVSDATPILEAMGATVCSVGYTHDVEKLTAFCKKNKVHFVLTDESCSLAFDSWCIQHMIPVISEDWLIEVMVTGEFAQIYSHALFRPIRY